MPKSRKKFPRIQCALEGCNKRFDPKVEHQKYCSDSHRVAAFNERRLKKAVDAGVAERLRELGITQTNP